VTVLPKFVTGGKFAQFPTGLFQAAAGNGRYCYYDSANARNLSRSSPLNPVLCKLYVGDEPGIKLLISLLANEAAAGATTKVTRVPQLHREMTSAKIRAEAIPSVPASTPGYNLAVAFLRGGPQMRTLFLNLVCPVADLSRLILRLRSLLSFRQLVPGIVERSEGGPAYNLVIEETVKGLPAARDAHALDGDRP
jgi:hypothetical protein